MPGLRQARPLARSGAVRGGVWCELILPGTGATTVAALMAGYTVLTLVGMMLFGPVAGFATASCSSAPRLAGRIGQSPGGP
jgi:uncharacterized membrane protein YdjX (TVP38/TMEM64 family)